VTFERASDVENLPSRRAWQWCVEGLRIWRRHPLKLFLLCLVPMLAEALLQLIPLAGVTLSKILALWVSLGILSGLAESERTGALRWSCLFDIFRQRRWSSATLLDAMYSPLIFGVQQLGRWRSATLLAVMYGPLIFGVQQLVAWLAYGWPAVDTALLGHVAAHPELKTRAFQSLLILPGIPIAVLLGLAPMYWLFTGATPWAAIRASARTVLHHPWPFGFYALIQLAVLTLILNGSVSMLLVLPYLAWATATSYAIWKDIRGVVPVAPMA
jgi:hypothetical protein